MNQRATCNALQDATTESLETNTMSLATLLLIVLIVMLIGAAPTWAYSRSWGYAPSGGLALVALVVLVLLLMGRV